MQSQKTRTKVLFFPTVKEGEDSGRDVRFLKRSLCNSCLTHTAQSYIMHTVTNDKQNKNKQTFC